MPASPARYTSSGRATLLAPRGLNTGLATTLDVAISCLPSGSASASVEGAVTTTGSTDSVVITLTVDGDLPVAAGVILPGAFVHAGRIKTAAYSVPVNLAAGTHVLGICLTQSGAAGRPSKAVCAEPTVDVVCNISGCADGQREGFTNLATHQLRLLPAARPVLAR